MATSPFSDSFEKSLSSSSSSLHSIKIETADFQLNQNVYAFSWSNQEHTAMNSGFHFSVYDDISPVLPYLSVNVGYVIENRKRW